MDITVAIDCMGGDHGPHVTVPAALNFLKSNSNVDIVLVGLRDAIEAELRAGGARSSPRLRVHPASEVVLMDESPALALRNKKDSSMRVAVDLVVRAREDGESAFTQISVIRPASYEVKRLWAEKPTEKFDNGSRGS